MTTPTDDATPHTFCAHATLSEASKAVADEAEKYLEEAWPELQKHVRDDVVILVDLRLERTMYSATVGVERECRIRPISASRLLAWLGDPGLEQLKTPAANALPVVEPPRGAVWVLAVGAEDRSVVFRAVFHEVPPNKA